MSLAGIQLLRFTFDLKARLLFPVVPALLQFRGGSFLEALADVKVLLVLLEDVHVCGEEEGAEGGDCQFEEEDSRDGDEEDDPEEEIVAGVVEEVVWDLVDAFSGAHLVPLGEDDVP